jgi:hypothetical protein
MHRSLQKRVEVQKTREEEGARRRTSLEVSSQLEPNILSITTPALAPPFCANLGSLMPVRQGMTFEGVAAWLTALDIAPGVVQTVEAKQVPGSQLAAMSVAELTKELGLSKLQAKRVVLAIAGVQGLVPPSGTAQ